MVDETSESVVNRMRIGRAKALMEEMLRTSLRRGYFGTAAIEVRIADGTVQQVTQRLERVDR